MHTSKDISTSQNIDFSPIAQELRVDIQIVTEIYEQYKKYKHKDSYAKPIRIIYTVISNLRKHNKNFPITLEKRQDVINVYKKYGLIEKRVATKQRLINGLILLSPKETFKTIALYEDIFLEEIRARGLSTGYRHFADTINTILRNKGENIQIPKDWQYLTRELENKGTNQSNSAGIDSIALSEHIRISIKRIMTGKPLYPTKEQIQNNQKFKNFLIFHLELWQRENHNGGFFHALTEIIKIWNKDINNKDAILPSLLIPPKTRKQTSLGGILELKTFGVQDFLTGLGIDISAWKKKKKWRKSEQRFLKEFQKLYPSTCITKMDFSIKEGIVRFTPEGYKKIVSHTTIDTIQELYES